MELHEDPSFPRISTMLDSLYARVDDLIAQQEKQLEDCKRKDELESKLAQEIKLNSELGGRAAALCARDEHVSRLCAALRARLNVADTDQARLASAREMFQIGKELTGVHWDFEEPPGRAKGYMKSEQRKWLHPFNLEAEGEVDAALWGLMHPQRDKENQPH